MRIAELCLTLTVITLLVAGCGRGSPSGPSGRVDEPASRALVVFVSVPPHAYLARKVGGNRVTVETIVPPGQSPHSYEPKPSQIAALENAALYFRAGIPFEEGFISSLSGPRVVDLREGLELRKTAGHSHGAESVDPHVWLDPRLAILQGEAMATAMAQIDPQGADQYYDGAKRLRTELTKTDEEIRKILRPVVGARFHVFHPAFGYFAAAYGLTQVAIEKDGKEPTPRQVAETIRQARADGARVIFVQPQFATASAEAAAREIGARVVPLDPLAEDLPANLIEIAVAIRAGLSGTKMQATR